MVSVCGQHWQAANASYHRTVYGCEAAQPVDGKAQRCFSFVGYRQRRFTIWLGKSPIGNVPLQQEYLWWMFGLGEGR
jgi:hypothetical protein